MKRILLLVTVLLVASVSAKAQTDHTRWEAYGTYSIFRADIDVLDNETLHGWGVGIQGNLNKYFSGVFEYTANHGASGPVTIQLPGTLLVIPDLDTRFRTFAGGPRVTYRTKPVNVYAHALFGGSNVKLRDEKGGSGFEDGNTEFAMIFGGGIDVNLGRHYAIRAGQFDYVGIHTDINKRLTGGGGVGSIAANESSWLHNFRYQVGFVFRF
ncbi:MAG TPA: outer membrane beta-barrel protein [Blastocatellia bacterium]|nr:outer membrane beta-barrel protein [Blastocatellia bacterium]